MAKKRCGLCGVKQPKQEMVKDDEFGWLCQGCVEEDSDSSTSLSSSETPSSGSSTTRPLLPKPTEPLPRAKVFVIPDLNPQRKMDLSDE